MAINCILVLDRVYLMIHSLPWIFFFVQAAVLLSAMHDFYLRYNVANFIHEWPGKYFDRANILTIVKKKTCTRLLNERASESNLQH